MQLVPPGPPESVTPASRQRIASATACHLLDMMSARIGADDKHGLAPAVIGELVGNFFAQAQVFKPSAIEESFSRSISASFAPFEEMILGIYRYLDEYSMTPDMPWIEEVTDRQACMLDNPEDGILGLIIKDEGRAFAVLFPSESIHDPENSFSPFHFRRLDASQPLPVLGGLLQKPGALMPLVMDTSVSFIASFAPVQFNPTRWSDPYAFRNWDAISKAFIAIQSLADTFSH